MTIKNDRDKKGTGPELLSLAPEIIENIIKQIYSKKDLSSTRLACKELDKHATKQLFSYVFLSPSEDHIKAWNSISENDIMRQSPRQAIIHTCSEMDDDDYPVEEEENVIEDFENALAALSNFPNLDSLEVTFTEDCVGEREDSWWVELTETMSRRKELLTLIFQAIKGRAADKQNRAIRKLTIINLQNCPIPDFTSSDLFRDVMAQLDELHISLIQESNIHGPDYDYTRVELRTFPAYFISDWLMPVSANLKALSIYSHKENWGPFPGKFDFSPLSFPKLRRLALGYYTLAHDNDIDWILRIKELKILILHNCMIARRIRIDPPNTSIWNLCTDNWIRMTGDAGDDWPQWSYGGTWSTALDRIRVSLPDLREFAFDQPSASPWKDGRHYGLLYQDRCGVSVFPKRYVVFDNGILPTHWPEANNYDGKIYSWLKGGWPFNMHQTHFDVDQESLERLLQTLNERLWNQNPR